jgi:hypothetical protein
MIQPTVGRIVLYRPMPNESNLCPVGHNCAAIIAFVHSDHCVNLTVFDSNGGTTGRTSVHLVQPNDEVPGPGGYCQWMPYQIKKPTGSESGEQAAGTQSI